MSPSLSLTSTGKGDVFMKILNTGMAVSRAPGRSQYNTAVIAHSRIDDGDAVIDNEVGVSSSHAVYPVYARSDLSHNKNEMTRSARHCSPEHRYGYQQHYSPEDDKDRHFRDNIADPRSEDHDFAHRGDRIGQRQQVR